jgi:UDP-N-acetylmuramoyl-tripeptide--D-alanyl-D-alanine ligase
MTGPLWTFAEIAAATKGRARRDGEVFGVAVDSKEICHGDLFIALSGSTHDGHEFVREALGKGAVAALIAKTPKGMKGTDPRLIRVKNTMAGLRALAQAARKRTTARIIAVTGSAGKTGTKNAIYQALLGKGLTHTSERSFNNHVGVPLSLARLPREAKFAVLEIGMNAPGEIAPLAKLVKPQVALITAIGRAHVAAFKTERDIAREKASIFDGLAPGGVAIVNADAPFAAALLRAAKDAGAKEILTYSLKNKGADALPVKLAYAETCTCLTAKVADSLITFKIAMPGRHWVSNGLATLLAIKAVGGDLGLAGLALASLAPLPGRGTVHDITAEKGAFRVVDDSYNANPASFQAALETFAAMGPAAAAGRKIGVFADMEELGAQSRKDHLALKKTVVAAGLTCLYVKGPGMEALLDALKGRIKGFAFSENQGLFQKLKQDLRNGDLVLVKGSRRAGLDQVVDQLLALRTGRNVSGWGAPVEAAE